MPKLWLGFHNPTYVDIEETVSMQVNKEGNLLVVQLKGKSRPVFIELTVENEAHLIREAVSKLDDSIFTNYRQKDKESCDADSPRSTPAHIGSNTQEPLCWQAIQGGVS